MPDTDEFEQELLDDLAQAERLHRGDEIRMSALAILELLPRRYLVLVSTSIEGAALAAACSALAPERTLVWRLVNLTRSGEPDLGTEVMVIEPSDPGIGWRDAVTRRYPGAHFAFASQIRQPVTA